MRRRQGFHSNLTVSSALRYHSTSLSNWYNLSLIFTCTNGGESKKGSQKSPFLAINSKGGESIKPKSKRTAPPPNFTCVSKIFQFVSCYVNLFNWYVYFQLVPHHHLILLVFRKIFNWYLVMSISSIGMFIFNWYI
jgi:hypothetical protein